MLKCKCGRGIAYRIRGSNFVASTGWQTTGPCNATVKVLDDDDDCQAITTTYHCPCGEFIAKVYQDEMGPWPTIEEVGPHFIQAAQAKGEDCISNFYGDDDPMPPQIKRWPMDGASEVIGVEVIHRTACKL